MLQVRRHDSWRPLQRYHIAAGVLACSLCALLHGGVLRGMPGLTL